MSRFRLTRLAVGIATASVLAALPPRALRAQPQTRAFTVCFTTGVQSCTWLELTTNAFFAGGAGRVGTELQVVVRHNEGAGAGAAVTSALTSFFFSYAGASTFPVSGASVSDELGRTAAVTPLDGAPTPGTADGWQNAARSSTTSTSSLFDNYLSFMNVRADVSDKIGVQWSQYVGGCGVAATGGTIDAFYLTDVWTCDGGQYRFSGTTDAWFDANDVNTVGISTYARFADNDYGVAAWCNATLDAPGSEGDADGSFTLGDVCSATAPPPSTTVPEPSTFVLVASAVLGVVVMRRRARVG